MANLNLTLLNTKPQANTTSIDECPNLLAKSVELRVFILIVYAIVIIIGLTGNALIIYIVTKNKPMRTSTNMLFVNMAVCDIGIACIMAPKRMSEVLTDKWLIPGVTGQVLCKMVPFLHDVFTEGSTYSLLLITLDRFISVVLPHKHWLSSKLVVVILILCTWVASASVNVVILTIFGLVNSKTDLYCTFSWKHSHEEFLAYVFTMITIHFIFPIVFIPTAYAAIFCKMKFQFASLSHSISDQSRLQDLMRQRKIVIMAFAIVCGFAVCWSPLALQGILQSSLFLNQSSAPCPFRRFQISSHYFVVFISVTNPIICFTFGTVFTENLKRICRRFFRCGRRSVSVANTDVELVVERLEGPAG